MRILLDTNIIIHREAVTVVNQDIGLLFNWLDKTGATKIVHPNTMTEIRRHANESVIKTMAIKIQNYESLRTLSDDSEAITQIREYDNSENDKFDTDLIKELYNGRVDLIITEDRGIHSKADRLGISEKVYKIDSYLEKVTAENPDLKDYKVLAVRKKHFGEVNLQDQFFDSFKTDYQEFEKWFNRKEGEICYVCDTDNAIGAFLYLKVEDKNEGYGDIEPAFRPKKRLKIGTLKVTSNGYKLGERFLKIVFDNAQNYKVDEIYVTIFDKREDQIRLMKLFEDWGFVFWGTKNTRNGTEKVFIRDFSPTFNMTNPKLIFPFVSRNNTNYIVPIYPRYHTELLPDSVLTNETPDDYIENEPHRNALQKVYISRSFNRDLNRGDLILFYRTGGYYKSVITTLGIVDSMYDNISSEKRFLELCRKRSVFTDEELLKHWYYNKKHPPFIVNFLYVQTFPNKINLARLIELGIIKDINSAPRGFEPLTLDHFNTILKESKADESYFID
ncbi:MAG: PIN domain-containing protein [Calditrichia bacterium]